MNGVIEQLAPQMQPVEAPRPQVSGVLVTYRRDENVLPIVERMLRDGFDEVLLWDNARPSGESREYWEGRLPGGVTVYGSSANRYLLARFLVAGLASNDVIATCDDDWLVDDWGPLLKLHEQMERPSLVHSLPPRHLQREANGQVPWALLGWGSVFDRSLLEVMATLTPTHGGDLVFQRKADRIWSALVREQLPPVTIEAVPCHGQNLHGATGPDALYRQGDHARMTELSMRLVDMIQGRISEGEYRGFRERFEAGASVSR